GGEFIKEIKMISAQYGIIGKIGQNDDDILKSLQQLLCCRVDQQVVSRLQSKLAIRRNRFESISFKCLLANGFPICAIITIDVTDISETSGTDYFNRIEINSN
ncbi:1467_t:CDS:2, partial [Racocetra persica]